MPRAGAHLSGWGPAVRVAADAASGHGSLDCLTVSFIGSSFVVGDESKNAQAGTDATVPHW